MKKLKYILGLLLATVFILPFASCGKDKNVITIGASATPHKQILDYIKDDIKEEGYKLEIIVYGDYVMPNQSLKAGDLDANYFQHEPFLINFNENNKANLVNAGRIHYEPMGVYAKGISSLDEADKITKIIVPSDPSNQARALLLLAENNIITLKEGSNLKDGISVLDIKDKKGKDVTSVEAASIPPQLKQADNGTMAVINGNYALNAKIDLSTALAIEKSDSSAAIEFANIIAVRKGDENSDKIKALIKVLKSDKVKDYIRNTFKGAVLPAD